MLSRQLRDQIAVPLSLTLQVEAGQGSAVYAASIPDVTAEARDQ